MNNVRPHTTSEPVAVEERPTEEQLAAQKQREIENERQQRIKADRDAAAIELDAMQKSYNALHQLTREQLARAFRWLEVSLNHKFAGRIDEEPPF